MTAKDRADRRRTRVKRPNPMARSLRAGRFRARTERNRRKYTRKAKHPTPPEAGSE